MADAAAAAEEAGADGLWEPSYYSLVALEKMMRVPQLAAVVDADKGDGDCGLLSCCSEMLLHPHAWVRVAAARVLGVAMSAVKAEAVVAAWEERTTTREEKKTKKKKSKKQKQQKGSGNATLSLFLAPGELFLLIRRTCRQLESAMLTEALATQAVRNLLVACKVASAVPDLAFSGDDDEAANGEAKDNEKDKDPLSWVFHRMSFMARSNSARATVRRSAVFKFFAAMATQFPVDAVCKKYLVVMLSPLFRVTNGQAQSEGGSDAPATSKLRMLASEVEALLSKLAGEKAFVEAYNEVRAQVASIRESRKRKVAELAIRDPEAAARRKVQKNRRKMERRKAAGKGKGKKRSRKEFQV